MTESEREEAVRALFGACVIALPCVILAIAVVLLA
jgi:hypothetical protein